MNSELKTILADTLGLPLAQITDEASTENLAEWDSVAHINFILSLEARYGLSFAPEEILDLGSLEKIQQTLVQRGVKL